MTEPACAVLHRQPTGCRQGAPSAVADSLPAIPDADHNADMTSAARSLDAIVDDLVAGPVGVEGIRPRAPNARGSTPGGHRLPFCPTRPPQATRPQTAVRRSRGEAPLPPRIEPPSPQRQFALRRTLEWNRSLPLWSRWTSSCSSTHRAKRHAAVGGGPEHLYAHRHSS